MAANRISSRDNDQCTKRFSFDAKLIFIFYASIFVLFIISDNRFYIFFDLYFRVLKYFNDFILVH